MLVEGFRQEMFTVLPDVNPVPVNVIGAPAGPDVGERSRIVPKLNEIGLPKPVT